MDKEILAHLEDLSKSEMMVIAERRVDPIVRLISLAAILELAGLDSDAETIRECVADIRRMLYV